MVQLRWRRLINGHKELDQQGDLHLLILRVIPYRIHLDVRGDHLMSRSFLTLIPCWRMLASLK